MSPKKSFLKNNKVNLKSRELDIMLKSGLLETAQILKHVVNWTAETSASLIKHIHIQGFWVHKFNQTWIKSIQQKKKYIDTEQA